MNLKKQLNYYGKNKIPILFIISFDLKTWDIIELNNIPNDILYKIDDQKKYETTTKIDFIKNDFKKYKDKFDKVIQNIKEGNTYVFNLTTQTSISNKLSLNNIYQNCNAKYKLYYKNKFLSFSPETFVKISDNKIFSFPMKGTINASIKNAKERILNDEKELAEHTMIVDLIRNDLGIVSKNITVDKFRYIEKIKAGQNELYQVSSQISGNLKTHWQKELGDIVTSLLPAGSISGAPKKSTIDLINQIEDYDRNYYTGIWGVFDGNTLDSAVLIRFIENNNKQYTYKSGGGITIDSDCIKEYNEIYEKIYIP